MSKKLFASNRWKAYLRRRQIAALRSVHRHSARRPATGSRGRGETVVIKSPEFFSILENTERTLSFLNDVEDFCRRGRVSVDFRQVERMTPEAPMALIALMSKNPSRISGSHPEKPDVRAQLIASGFYEHVHHRLNVVQHRRGRIAKFSTDRVNSAFARELVRYGIESLTGAESDSEASYGVLLEAMENTVQHSAQPPKGLPKSMLQPERWWALVSADKDRNCVCFAILDTGVGIFRSAKLKLLRKAQVFLRERANEDLLRDMLAGKIGSRTEEEHRGKGLPSIRKASDEGAIQSLTIITNSVRANIPNDDFMTLQHQFSGTLLYWEISI